VITSNRTREIHDALKRRCLYHWVPIPMRRASSRSSVPGLPTAPEALSREVVGFVQALRSMELFKPPGVAETLDWVGALVELDAIALDPQTVNDTLGVLLKYQDDIARLEGSPARRLIEQVRSDLAQAPPA
jgi:MoxR-like ATPase